MKKKEKHKRWEKDKTKTLRCRESTKKLNVRRQRGVEQTLNMVEKIMVDPN